MTGAANAAASCGAGADKVDLFQLVYPASCTPATLYIRTHTPEEEREKRGERAQAAGVDLPWRRGIQGCRGTRERCCLPWHACVPRRLVRCGCRGRQRRSRVPGMLVYPGYIYILRQGTRAGVHKRQLFIYEPGYTSWIRSTLFTPACVPRHRSTRAGVQVRRPLQLQV